MSFERGLSDFSPCLFPFRHTFSKTLVFESEIRPSKLLIYARCGAPSSVEPSDTEFRDEQALDLRRARPKRQNPSFLRPERAGLIRAAGSPARAAVWRGVNREGAGRGPVAAALAP